MTKLEYTAGDGLGSLDKVGPAEGTKLGLDEGASDVVGAGEMVGLLVASNPLSWKRNAELDSKCEKNRSGRIQSNEKRKGCQRTSWFLVENKT